jgi:hypothetical protein
MATYGTPEAAANILADTLIGTISPDPKVVRVVRLKYKILLGKISPVNVTVLLKRKEPGWTPLISW